MYEQVGFTDFFLFFPPKVVSYCQGVKNVLLRFDTFCSLTLIITLVFFGVVFFSAFLSLENIHINIIVLGNTQKRTRKSRTVILMQNFNNIYLHEKLSVKSPDFYYKKHIFFVVLLYIRGAWKCVLLCIQLLLNHIQGISKNIRKWA